MGNGFLNQYLTGEQAAEYLNLSVHTLNAWRRNPDSDGPPWVSMGAAIRYRRSDLDAWASSKTKNGDDAGA